MNTGCFKCDKAQWDADGCTCKITGLLVGNAERGCEYCKDIELKPCPFCGSKSVWVADNILDYLFIGYNVHCNGCGAETRYTKDRDKAIERWNRRAENDN